MHALPEPPVRDFSEKLSNNLRESGLSDDTITKNGLRCCRDINELSRLLGFQYPTHCGPAIVFPFRTLGGKALEWCRVKPTNPMRDKNGAESKYLSPKNGGVHAYFPVDALPAINTDQHELLITEGEKKALKATQEGFPTIGLTGVDCFAVKGVLLPELESINWLERRVLIVFDSDRLMNPRVLNAECQIAASLQARGAIVRIVQLPGAVPK